MEVPPADDAINAGYLKAAIDLTHEHGALFILDEIVTGFRYSIGGAHKLYGVMPDLVCIGKAMANGLPISAVCGKREYMQHFSADTTPAVFYSTTFAGETSSIMAALETIEVIESKGVIDHIWSIGKSLRDGMRELASQYGIRLDMPGNPPRSLINLLDKEGNPSLLLKSVFIQECCQDGVLFGVPVFPTFSHTEKDVERTLSAVDHAFKLLSKYRGHEQDLLTGNQMEGTFVRK
jgi:glutamate-1-semialdehyde aminotransferase